MGYLHQNEQARGLARDHHALPGRGMSLTEAKSLPAFGLLRQTAARIPDRIAVIDGDRQWDYQTLDRDCETAAAMLQRLGVMPGDRVGILLPNVAEYIIAANAIWRAGGCAIAISPLMVAPEVDDLLQKTGCRYAIALDVLSHVVHTASSRDVKTILVSIREKLSSLEQLGYLWMRHRRTGSWSLSSDGRRCWFWEEIERTDQKWQPITIHPEIDPAYILPTGGTTGTPKAVTLSHTNMVANAWQQHQWVGQSFGDQVMLGVLPFFHSYGMSATIMGGIAMGATLALHHRFNTRRTIKMIDQYQPTVFHAVPAMLVAMNEHYRQRPPQSKTLKWVISGGASLDPAVGREFSEHTGALVVEGYGLSEASPVTHVGPLFDAPRYGTIGLPLPETDCRLVDAADGLAEVDQGQVGELIVRGPQVMLGYWNDPEGTCQTIRDAWLHTGDLAIRTDDGFYQIVGRKKDLIITSGYNVYPSEVEAVIRDADGVSDVAVIGHPDPKCGERVKAVVVMHPSASWDEDRLRRHCEKRLSKHKRPRIYEQCVGDLPRNFLGKVIRRHLRETVTSTEPDLAPESAGPNRPDPSNTLEVTS